jgi:hypothetical protein
MRGAFLRTAWMAMAMALATAAGACGGSSGGSCGKVEPCGGNPVGAWKVSGSCVNSAALMSTFTDSLGDSCTGATISNASVAASGTLSLNADMTYTINGDQMVKFTVNVPASCLNGATCADLATQLQNDFPNATCTGSSSCACALSDDSPQIDSGTYTVSGTQIVSESSSQGESSQSFCVQGNTLHLIDVDTTMNMGPMGMATIDDDTLFTKQ